MTRRVTAPPSAPAIAAPEPPGDPGWTIRNRPARAAQPEAAPAPAAPDSAIGDVAMVDRPAVVEERPIDPQAAASRGDDAETETVAREDPGDAGGPAVDPWEGEQARVLFEGADTAFGPGVRTMLDRIAARLHRDADLRLTVLSYAGGEPEAAGHARLLSLTRALAVRDYLTDRNIRQARIAVRGLGDSAEEGPPDRIDLLLGP
ncbi:MAG: OmpA family protein [Alphaproteobacteria bacterium]|nr:OmpA family protein [Alphaproteobacteria bacterium]